MLSAYRNQLKALTCYTTSVASDLRLSLCSFSIIRFSRLIQDWQKVKETHYNQRLLFEAFI